MGVAADVVILQDIVPHGIGVVATEPVAPVIAIATELSLTCLGFAGARVGTNTQITTADRQACPRLH